MDERIDLNITECLIQLRSKFGSIPKCIFKSIQLSHMKDYFMADIALGTRIQEIRYIVLA